MLFNAIALSALAVVAQAANTQVSVGAFTNGTAGLVFDPPSVNAAVGDTISFVFHPKNHSVTQSTFANPCTRLNNATTGQQGLALGFHPAAATDPTFTSITISVNATTPTWWYCGQAGMVFAINAPSTGNTFAAFQAAAKATTAATNTTGTPGTTPSGSSAAPAGSSTVPATTGVTGSASTNAIAASTGLLALLAFLVLA